MANISFNNNGISPKLSNKALLKIFLETIFLEEKVDFERVSYIFCTDAFLHKLNVQYLNHDTLTDVITFTLSETSLPIISEIYISVERVEDNAKRYEKDFHNEILRVMIHGILHLCGFSDHTPQLKSEIREKEDYYLSKYQTIYANK